MKKNINGIYFFIVIFIFAIIMLYFANVETLYYVNTDRYFTNVSKKIDNSLSKLLEYQDKTDNSIKEAIKSHSYTLDNPYILVNPYKVNPLSSIIFFETKESESVELYINDSLMTTFPSSNEHIIPIYGLYSNTNNFVTIKTSKGTSNTIKITTEAYDDNTGNIKVSDYTKDNNTMFLLGSLDDDKNTLRGFDYNGNLIYYMSLDYISSFSFTNDKLIITYNQKNSKKDISNDILIEMDYLGRIESIRENNDIVTYNFNEVINNKEYLCLNELLYKDNTINYSLVRRMNNIRGKSYSQSETRNLTSYLDQAKLYEKNADITLNANRIDTNINEDGKNVSIMLVSKNTPYTYIYYLIYNDSLFDSSFVFDQKGEYSLFLNIDNKYYNLNTIINIE